MPLNIKNERVERLATEVAAHLVAFLERDVWPFLPADALGHAPSKATRERILGYGAEGV